MISTSSLLSLGEALAGDINTKELCEIISELAYSNLQPTVARMALLAEDAPLDPVQLDESME